MIVKFDYGEKIMSVNKLNPQCEYPTVFFGEYSIPSDCKPNDIFVRCPIEWMIVEKDDINKNALLVAKHAIDWEIFGSYAESQITSLETSWEKSYLRTWLNDDFFNDSFSKEEQKKILSVYISANSHGEKRTINKVFLLSVEEVKKYFTKETANVVLMPMIDGVCCSNKENPISISCYPITWWTRTTGKEKNTVMCLDETGVLCELNAECDEVGVRPAMWVEF